MNKVSVIVPVYNVEKYLRKCLNSLVAQSLKEMEIIIVNDGSTDDSQKIIDDFQRQYPSKIKSFIKENGGLSDARNFGLDQANGDYIGFVDSDDEVDERMFEEMYNLAIQHHAEMVICNLHKVDETGRVIEKLPQFPNMPECIDVEENFSVFSDLSYFACNKLFKRELFENKRFKIGMHFEDIQLIPQLLLECKVIAKTQRYYYHYLQRKDSISKTHDEKGLDILKAVKDVEEAFRHSQYAHKMLELKNFQILEGVYTFLAYLAYIQDDLIYQKLSKELKTFLVDRNISRADLFQYKRFRRNYLLYLPLNKKVYYTLYFLGQEKLLRKLAKNTF